MTVIEAFDLLHGKQINRVEFRNRPPLVCPAPTLVEAEPTDSLNQVWLLVEPDGLSLSFNAKDQYGEWRVYDEPLANVTAVY